MPAGAIAARRPLRAEGRYAPDLLAWRTVSQHARSRSAQLGRSVAGSSGCDIQGSAVRGRAGRSCFQCRRNKIQTHSGAGSIRRPSLADNPAPVRSRETGATSCWQGPEGAPGREKPLVCRSAAEGSGQERARSIPSGDRGRSRAVSSPNALAPRRQTTQTGSGRAKPRNRRHEILWRIRHLC